MFGILNFSSDMHYKYVLCGLSFKLSCTEFEHCSVNFFLYELWLCLKSFPTETIKIYLSIFYSINFIVFLFK